MSIGANIVLMNENEDDKSEILRLLKAHDVDEIHIDEIRKVYGGTQNVHLPKKPTIIYRKPNFRADESVFNRNNSVNSCWHGKMTISTDGTVFPCEFERNITLGNIRSQSLETILKSEQVRKYWYLSFDKIKQCKLCEYRFACKDCRPISYAENGCFLDKNPRCCYNPATGAWGTNLQ